MLKIKRLFSAILVVIILLVSDAAIIASALNTENSQFEDTVKPAESIEPIDDEYCCNGCLVEDVDEVSYSSESENNIGYSKKDIAPLSSSTLPSSVDNSDSVYFPYIFKQGVVGFAGQRQMGGCVSAAMIHYQFTYEYNKARGIKTTRDNTFSSQWVYNFTNVRKNGSRDYTTMNFMIDTGCPSFSSVPYNGIDCYNWCFDTEIWREAMNNRISEWGSNDSDYGALGYENTQITSADDTDLIPIKNKLANGKLLNVDTYFTSHVNAKLKANPDLPENDKFEGEAYVRYVDGRKGLHSMTVVGYNDDLWCDINDNDKVDAGEMGAFKVVNSHGETYANNGFIWVAYDAMNKVSVVEGGNNPEGRNPCLIGFRYFEVNTEVQPEIYVKFTVNTADRTQFAFDFTATNGTKTYSGSFLEGVRHKEDSVAVGFDGTENASTATFLYRLKNMVPELNGDNFDSYDFSIIASDNKKDDKPLIVKDVTIVNEYTGEEYKINNEFPVSLDGSEYRAPIKTGTTSICYIGYDNPILHYKVSDGDFKEVAMKESDAEKGYQYIHVFEDVSEDVTLYFSDKNGNVDDNNGEYYTASKGVNNYYTKNQREKVVINDFNVTNDINAYDLSKVLHFDIDVSGGYGPYGYVYTVENLDTGVKTVYDYYHTLNNQTCYFKSEGRHRITVKVIDRANETATMTKEFEFKNYTFKLDTITPNKENGLVSKPLIFESVTAFESFSQAEFPLTYFSIKNSKGVEVLNRAVYSTSYNESDATSTTRLTFTPSQAGEYTLFAYSVDAKQIREEKVIKFKVCDRIIGDTGGDGIISIMD
ncbi:MAG: hypothetical protein IKB73_02280, partial [Ruminococcus sp.]|nr:hypothetical protein [Ruminococcus sp.]